MNESSIAYLLLASADSAATLSDHAIHHWQSAARRVEAHRHVLDESIDVHLLDHLVELLFRGVLRLTSALHSHLRAVENVRSNGSGEQNRLLRDLSMSRSLRSDDGDHASHEIPRQIVDVHAVQQDFAFGDFVQTAEKRGNRALPGPRAADDSDILSGMSDDV